MRKITLLAVVVLALAGLVFPVAAQEGNIVDVAAGNENFSSLVAAVLAADPAIAETLVSEGPFTVFAPTNQAFSNLADFLGVSLEDILADQDLVTTVLLYHVVAGAVSSGDVVGLDGELVPTLLDGAFIGVSVQDGSVFLNDVVQVVQTDIAASNGVIHVISDVLLPQSVLDALAEAEMEPAVPETPTVPANVNIRVGHLSPDTPPVDVYVNGEAAITGLAFPNFTGWITLPAGTYNLAVAPAGTSIEDAAIGPADFNLPGGQFLTISAVGSLEAGTLAPVIADEVFATLGEGEASVTVFHAIEGVGPVDLTTNGTVLIDFLAFPGTFQTAAGVPNDGAFTFTAPAGVYDLQVVPNGQTEPVIFDLAGTELLAGHYYFVAAVGTPDDPQIIVDVTGPERGAELLAAAAERIPVEEEEEAVEAPAGTIVDLAVATDDFSTLVAAVQAADPGILEALAGDGPLTVFAPTNQAFANLLSALGLTAEELLAATDILNQVLLYHVIPGDVRAATVVGLDGESVATLLDGAFIGIGIVDGGVVLNGVVNVIATDVVATNGVIHVIDQVLLPQSVIDALGL